METRSIKLMALWNYINDAEVDICVITKCNINWKQAPAHLYPTEQTRYWWENSQWSITQNNHETNKAAYKPGSTMLAIINQLSHWAQHPGDNKARLCWARLHGKQNKILRIMLAYRSSPTLTTRCSILPVIENITTAIIIRPMQIQWHPNHVSTTG